MEYATLRPDFRVSRVGFGCAPIGGYDYGPVDEGDAIRAIHAALDAGINFFDNADVYGFGRAEELLGKALSGRRHEAVIATKVGLAWQSGKVTRDASRRHVTDAIDASLRRLQIEVIDLLQIHWPDPLTPVAETAAALLAAVEAGKVRAVGCSNFSVELARALDEAVPVATVQCAYNLLCRQPEPVMLPWCRERGIGFLAHSTLARGALGNPRRGRRTFAGSDTRTRSRYFEIDPSDTALFSSLETYAMSEGIETANVAVRWVLEQPGVSSALVGMRTPAHVRVHARTFDFKLPEATIAHLQKESSRIEGVMTGELAR